MNRLEKRFKKHFAHKPGLIKTGMGWGLKKHAGFFLSQIYVHIRIIILIRIHLYHIWQFIIYIFLPY